MQIGVKLERQSCLGFVAKGDVERREAVDVSNIDLASAEAFDKLRYSSVSCMREDRCQGLAGEPYRHELERADDPILLIL